MAQTTIGKYYDFEIAAHDLKKMDLMGLSDPYLVIEAPLDRKPRKPKSGIDGWDALDTASDLIDNGWGADLIGAAIVAPFVAAAAATNAAHATHHTTKGYRQVYVSSVFKKTLNCRWPIFSVLDTNLCSGYIDQEILFKCYDWNKVGSSHLIGEVMTSVRELVNEEKAPVILALEKDGKIGRGSLEIKCTPSYDFSIYFAKNGVPSGSGFASGQWVGFYEYRATEKQEKTSMNVTMVEGVIAGQGSDTSGKFVIKGTYDATTGRAIWDKKYTGSHTIHYEGNLARAGQGFKIEGMWFSGGLPGGRYVLCH